MAKTRYVVGFCFTPSERMVVLIEKKRPKWPAGRFNGVGGKIEDGEAIREAMEREFYEEAGVRVPAEQWERFAILEGSNWEVHVLRAWSDKAMQASTQEEEEIFVWPVASIPKNTISNLCWLIPLALDAVKDGAPTLTTVSYEPHEGDSK